MCHPCRPRIGIAGLHRDHHSDTRCSLTGDSHLRQLNVGWYVEPIAFSLLLVAMPGAPSSFLFLVAMPFATSSFLFLVVRPGAPFVASRPPEDMIHVVHSSHFLHLLKANTKGTNVTSKRMVGDQPEGAPDKGVKRKVMLPVPVLIKSAGSGLREQGENGSSGGHR